MNNAKTKSSQDSFESFFLFVNKIEKSTQLMEFSVCAALSDRPMFAEPIPNVTVPLGRDVSLPCVVENLGNYKVIKSKNSSSISYYSASSSPNCSYFDGIKRYKRS